MWSAATVTCSVVPDGVSTVNVTETVVVLFSFMLLSTTEMPCAHEVPNDTFGSIPPCVELPHDVDDRVKLPSCVEVALSVAVTVGCAAVTAMSTTDSVPAGTVTSCAVPAPDGSMVTTAALLPASIVTVALEQLPATPPVVGT